MAVIYISEYATLALGGSAQIPTDPPLLDQTVAISVVAAASSPFQAGTRFIRVAPDAVCSILIGPPGTAAAATNKRLPANAVEYFGVVSGQVLSVITNT